MFRPILRLIAITATLLVASVYTFAGNSDRFQTNRDIHVETNDNPNDVTCFRCSIYVRGEVRGDVTAMAATLFLRTAHRSTAIPPQSWEISSLAQTQTPTGM